MADADSRPLVDDTNGPTDTAAHVSRAVYERVLAELDAVRALAAGDASVRIPAEGVVREVYKLRRRVVEAERELGDARKALARRPLDAAGCVVRAAELLDKAATQAAVGKSEVADTLARTADRWITLAFAPQVPAES